MGQMMRAGMTGVGASTIAAARAHDEAICRIRSLASIVGTDQVDLAIKWVTSGMGSAHEAYERLCCGGAIEHDLVWNGLTLDEMPLLRSVL